MTNPPPAEGPARLKIWACVAVPCAWLLSLLFVQVRHPFPFLNDDVFHFGLIRSLASAHLRGQSALDPWVPTWCLGYPVFHYYQSLPHYLVIGLWKVFGHSGSLLQCFKLVEWLAVGTMPVPVYLGMRRLGFARAEAAAAAALAPLIKTNYLHGNDLESYVWQGLGEYTQAVGGWLFPLAIAWIATALRTGRNWGTAALLLSATFLSHLALGTMAAFAGGVIALVTPASAPKRIVRLGVIGLITALGCAWMLLPIVRDFAWYNVSTLVPSWKYQSFGADVILPWLVHGDIFDFERVVTIAGRAIGPLPWLTLLVGGGVALAGWRVRREAERTLLALFVFFLLLYFGRPTWGDLLRLVPLGSAFHYSRAVFGVHVLGTMLAGVFVGGAVRWLAARRQAGMLAAAALIAIVFAPLLLERTAYLQKNAQLVREAAEGYAKEGPDLDRALSIAADDRDGRTYAGLGGLGQPWGGTFLVGWVPVYAYFSFHEMDALGYLYHMASLNSDLHNSFDDGNVADYQALGVRRIIAPEGVRVPPFAHSISRQGRFCVYGVDGPGLVQIVDVPYRLDVSKRNISRLHSAWLRSDLPARGIFPQIRLHEERGRAEGAGVTADDIDFRFPVVPPASSPPGEVLDVRREGEDFFVHVRADRPSDLVLKMTYHPLWHATVDGAPAATAQLMPSFVGVPLAPGEHDVALRFRADPKRKPLLAGGLLVLAAAALLGRRA